MDHEEQDINKAFEQLTGKRKNIYELLSGDILDSFMNYRIKNILLISTPYDFFLLEEEGRLSELFKKVYHQREEGYVPIIMNVNTYEMAMELFEKNNIDLVVIFNTPTKLDPITLAKNFIAIKPNIPIIFLANNTPELLRIARMEESRNFDKIFTWTGDGKIFLSIVQYIEDKFNLKEITKKIGPRIILLIEDSIQYYSQYLTIIYDEVWNLIESIIKEDLTIKQKKKRQKRRPKIVLATTLKEALEVYDYYNERILLIIFNAQIQKSNKDEKELFKKFIEIIKRIPSQCQVLILSNYEKDGRFSNDVNVRFLNKNTNIFNFEFSEMIRNILGLNDLSIKDHNGIEIITIKDMRTLEKAIWSIPDISLLKLASMNSITNWLELRTEFELAYIFRELFDQERTVSKLREKLIKEIEEYKRKIFQGAITSFSRIDTDQFKRFTRIGTGSLGGKARGLAFMDKILSAYIDQNQFPGVKIFIPKTVVICTDIFDTFIQQHKLNEILKHDLKDDRIAATFIEKDLPATILGDLRTFLRDTKGPIAVRSSSMLEDALFQPFAGVYSSIMLPNDSTDLDKRFNQLCNAIKLVYASTFFQKAKNYIETTPNKIEDEKMAVVIQELVGQKHGDNFYPTISGVAKSYNYYPVAKCKPEDGVVNLALGLGKTIVDGGTSFRFCPIKPNIPHYGTLKDLLQNSQTSFYAITFGTIIPKSIEKEGNKFLRKLDILDAEKEGVLNFIASTYSYQNEKLYPGIYHEGPKVLDFSSILQMDKIPLPKILQLILKISEIAIGCPVEIEFAINLDPENCIPAEFAYLQVRSMVSRKEITTVDLGDYPMEEIICYTENALGNGIRTDINDIVYVKPDEFELEKTEQIRKQISQINKSLSKIKKPYILIGPGRWGSTDKWLGIPVTWSDISNAGIIIEIPVKERPIDPSEGSHFFHNLTSSKVGYFTITNKKEQSINWSWLENLPIISETNEIRHVRAEQPMEIRIDGRIGKGLILKK